MSILKKHASLIVFGLLSLFFGLSLFLARSESAIYDERAHIPAAFTYVDRGDMRLNPEHPPILKDLAGFPLLFLHASFPYDAQEWANSGIEGQWTLGTKFLYQSGNDADSIIFWARLPIILIAVFLGWFIYFWTRELVGVVAGLFALLLYVADPNIIAHSHYMTTDIGIAAAIFTSFYFFLRFLRNPSRKNVILAGIFLGIAELVKFSAVLLYPIFGLFVILYALTCRKSDENQLSPRSFRWNTVLSYLFRYIGVVAVCFALIGVVYALNTHSMPADKIVVVADIKLSQPNIGARFAHSLVENTSHSALLKPYSVYFLGVAMVFGRIAGGNVFYFLGNLGSDAVPSYFPIIFLSKETIPFLFLLGASLIYTLSRIRKTFALEQVRSWSGLIAQSFQERITQYMMAFFVIFYIAVSVGGNLDIGFRHLFPIMPFLYVLVTKTVFDFLKRRSIHGKQVLGLVLGGFAFAIASIPLINFPFYLSYFNAAAGGHTNGYKISTDSNYDWGQNMKTLRDWVGTYNQYCISDGDLNGECRKILGSTPTPSLFPITKLRVDYFGGAEPKYYLSDTYSGWYDQLPREAGWYAISALFYQESVYKKNNPSSYRWIAPYSVGRAGDSIFLFYVPETAPELSVK